MDFSTLTPAPAPTHLPKGTVVVGERVRHTATALQTAFSSIFTRQTANQQDASPALVVTTSGSTGKPKQTVLSAAALRASAAATAHATDSTNAQWLLALPLHYVAGVQVIARSVLAGTSPVLTRSISHGATFTAADFLAASQKLTGKHTMTSLVPTQLHSLLETSGELGKEIVEALRGFTAILLGGASASQRLLSTCAELNIKAVTTYGSTETAGGCIYNNRPLPGVLVATDTEQRIWLGGPTLAHGYLNEADKTAASFFIAPDGNRWYRTDDIGEYTANTLTVQGRNDDVIISGGIKISGAQIAQALESHTNVREAFVGAVPHIRWGQAVAAAITLTPRASAAPTLTELKNLTRHLGKAAAPKHLLVLQEFPTLSTGKPDRQALTRLLAATARGENNR